MFNEVLEALKKLAEAFTTVQGSMRKHITLLANNALIHLFNIRKGPFYVIIPILIFHAKSVSAGSIDQQTGGFKRRQKLEDISMRGVGHFCFSLKIRGMGVWGGSVWGGSVCGCAELTRPPTSHPGPAGHSGGTLGASQPVVLLPHRHHVSSDFSLRSFQEGRFQNC